MPACPMKSKLKIKTEDEEREFWAKNDSTEFVDRGKRRAGNLTQPETDDQNNFHTDFRLDARQNPPRRQQTRRAVSIAHQIFSGGKNRRRIETYKVLIILLKKDDGKNRRPFSFRP